MKKQPKNSGKIIDINRREIRKRKKRAARNRFICFLAVIAVITFMMTPVFNIKWIDVTGNEKTKFGEIVKASGVDYEQNIFRLNIKKSKAQVKKIAYIDEVSIARHLPGGVMIKVTERVPVACIKYANGYMLIDKTGRLLETVKEQLNFPEIVGIKLAKQKAGETLKTTDEQRIVAMGELLDTLKEHELLERTSLINIKNADNVTFIIDGNKTVKTGGNYRLDYKLKMLEATVSELSRSEAGVIDLSVEGQALFTPEE
ncbi:MAG: FtsQ-type POTRA domain-containing protein [Clostridia bacterium]|nr:FtsQ-type POTRA domain-containing protein [Clostridia bacterium]